MESRFVMLLVGFWCSIGGKCEEGEGVSNAVGRGRREGLADNSTAVAFRDVVSVVACGEFDIRGGAFADATAEGVDVADGVVEES